MERSKITRIIEILENARGRKGVYMAPVSVDAAVNFLRGFHLAFFALGEQIPNPVFEDAYKQRGWDYTARGVWNDMRELGMADDAIVDELFALEIQAWRLMLDKLCSTKTAL